MARPSPAPDAKRRSTDEIVAVRGRRLRVRISHADAPSGPPLLVLNGIGASLDVLDPFVDALPKDCEVIRLDPPGVGGSPDVLLPYHLTTFAPVVGDLVTKLGYGRVDVLGFSWGGALAQQLAVARPAQVRRLVLVATSTGVLSVPAHPRVLARFLAPRWPSWPRDAAGALAFAADFYGGTVRTHPELAAGALAAVAESLGHRRRGYLQQLAAATGWTSLPLLRLIGARTLVIAGDDDPIIPSLNATILGRGIPNARVHRHPGGHLAIMTEARELAPVVADFLAAPEPWSAARAAAGS